MNQLIRINQASAAPPRAWWEVRGALCGALAFVCVIGAMLPLHPELRAAFRVTLLDPAALLLGTALSWQGWLPLGFAIAAGVPTAAALRRTRGTRQASAGPRRAVA